MEKLSYVDQAVNSPILQFITKSGRTIDVLEADVFAFIERDGLNVSIEGEGLSSDPYETDVEVITDAAVYLNNNFYEVCEMYFQSILINNLLKYVA